MKKLKVLGETYDQAEELPGAIRRTEAELARTPEEPARRREELEERLRVLRAVDRRLRFEHRRRVLLALAGGLVAAGVAWWKLPRHAKYVVGIAVAALAGVVAVYWYVVVAAGVAYGGFRVRRMIRERA